MANETKIKATDLFQMLDEQIEKKQLHEKMLLRLNGGGGGEEPVNDVPQVPPMDEPGNEPPMDEPTQNDDGMSNFGPKFDAGVEADPNSEPDKYIQQLTGKLATELRKYIEKNNDADIAKYVLGMIIAQACKPLTDADKKEMIDKINEVHGTESAPEEPERGAEPPIEDPQDAEQAPEDQIANQFESLQRLVTNEVMTVMGDDDEDDGIDMGAPVITGDKIEKNERNKPFIPKQYRNQPQE